MYAIHRTARGALERQPAIALRFWEQASCPTAPEECWSWRGPISRHGIPELRAPRVTIDAARLACWAVLGEFPMGGRIIRRCENPSCVRPTHLEWRASRRTRVRLQSDHEGYVRPMAPPTIAGELEALRRARALGCDVRGVAAA